MPLYIANKLRYICVEMILVSIFQVVDFRECSDYARQDVITVVCPHLTDIATHCVFDYVVSKGSKSSVKKLSCRSVVPSAFW